MGSLVSPKVANFYMGEAESRALINFTVTVPSYWSSGSLDRAHRYRRQ